MYVINAFDVNDAYSEGLAYLKRFGVREQTRAGEVLVSPCPVTTCYKKPYRRVLFDAERDAHPGFHLFEALWMLAGRQDATWLDRFVSDFSSRFAEDDGNLHGAYGFRWRNHFDVEGGGRLDVLPDQLETVIRLLRKNPSDRQAVIAMWDPVADLDVVKKDRPCNTHVYLRVNNHLEAVGGSTASGLGGAHQEPVAYLEMTVCCRSNDAVWGAYGANAVHFSVLQEYLAARIGVRTGAYYQVSNNFHVYTNVLGKLGNFPKDWGQAALRYLGEVHEGSSVSGIRPTPIVTRTISFDMELLHFFKDLEKGVINVDDYSNKFFPEVAWPMYAAFKGWREGDTELALHQAYQIREGTDWKAATLAWFERRLARRAVKEKSK